MSGSRNTTIKILKSQLCEAVKRGLVVAKKNDQNIALPNDFDDTLNKFESLLLINIQVFLNKLFSNIIDAELSIAVAQTLKELCNENGNKYYFEIMLDPKVITINPSILLIDHFYQIQNKLNALKINSRLSNNDNIILEIKKLQEQIIELSTDLILTLHTPVKKVKKKKKHGPVSLSKKSSPPAEGMLASEKESKLEDLYKYLKKLSDKYELLYGILEILNNPIIEQHYELEKCFGNGVGRIHQVCERIQTSFKIYVDNNDIQLDAQVLTGLKKDIQSLADTFSKYESLSKTPKGLLGYDLPALYQRLSVAYKKLVNSNNALKKEQDIEGYLATMPPELSKKFSETKLPQKLSESCKTLTKDFDYLVSQIIILPAKIADVAYENREARTAAAELKVTTVDNNLHLAAKQCAIFKAVITNYYKLHTMLSYSILVIKYFNEYEKRESEKSNLTENQNSFLDVQRKLEALLIIVTHMDLASSDILNETKKIRVQAESIMEYFIVEAPAMYSQKINSCKLIDVESIDLVNHLEEIIEGLDLDPSDPLVENLYQSILHKQKQQASELKTLQETAEKVNQVALKALAICNSKMFEAHKPEIETGINSLKEAVEAASQRSVEESIDSLRKAIAGLNSQLDKVKNLELKTLKEIERDAESVQTELSAMKEDAGLPQSFRDEKLDMQTSVANIIRRVNFIRANETDLSDEVPAIKISSDSLMSVSIIELKQKFDSLQQEKAEREVQEKLARDAKEAAAAREIERKKNEEQSKERQNRDKIAAEQRAELQRAKSAERLQAKSLPVSIFDLSVKVPVISLNENKAMSINKGFIILSDFVENKISALLEEDFYKKFRLDGVIKSLKNMKVEDEKTKIQYIETVSGLVKAYSFLDTALIGFLSDKKMETSDQENLRADLEKLIAHKQTENNYNKSSIQCLKEMWKDIWEPEQINKNCFDLLFSARTDSLVSIDTVLKDKNCQDETFISGIYRDLQTWDSGLLGWYVNAELPAKTCEDMEKFKRKTDILLCREQQNLKDITEKSPVKLMGLIEKIKQYVLSEDSNIAIKVAKHTGLRQVRDYFRSGKDTYPYNTYDFIRERFSHRLEKNSLQNFAYRAVRFFGCTYFRDEDVEDLYELVAKTPLMTGKGVAFNFNDKGVKGIEEHLNKMKPSSSLTKEQDKEKSVLVLVG